MGYRDAAGKPRGFIVEALDAAAARAGYTLDWRIIGNSITNNEALRRGDLDVIIGFSTEERRREFFMTEPWWSSEMVAVFPAALPIRDESGLNGKRLAIPGGAAAEIARYYPGGIPVPANSALEAVEAACTGKAEAALFANMFLRQLLSAPRPVCPGTPLRTIDSSFRLDYVLATLPSRSTYARKLKDALDQITSDGELASIAARNPPVSTPHATRLAEMLRARYDRRIWTIGMSAAGFIILLGVAFLARQTLSRRRLEESEARFRALFEAAPESVLAIDSSGIIVFANRASREMFARDVVGTPAVDLLVPQHRDAFSQPGPVEITAVRDGVEFPAEVVASPVETRDQLTLLLIADISARVALQRQLLQSQKLESVGQLAGGVAHDFNNLLTVISGYASMSLEQIDPEHFLYEPLEEIAQAADRAAALTRQLLAFSRRQAAAPKLLSLRDLLHNLEKMLRRLIGENIQLTIDVEDTAVIRADPGQIEQVVMNLVVNARDAMPAGGAISIRAGMSEDGVLLTVADTGTGMTPEVEARIFEPFFTTKELGKGTGLGLSTVYGIVKQAGGEIFVETAVGRGTTFKLVFPAAEGSPDASLSSGARPGSHGHETILVAEDELGVRRFVKDVLARNGYTVLEAGNGSEALDLAARHSGRIHLLITDLVMPEMGGVDLAARMSQSDPRPAVLFMSGYSDRPLAAEARGALIEKPFTPAALLDRVREVLGRHSAASPPPNSL
jgi:two-component system cell cycle sensor histidine kinase/response regulator CckA